MTSLADSNDEGRAEAAYLWTPRAVRERAETMYALVLSGKMRGHFAIDESKLGDVAERVVQVTRAAHPDVTRIGYHSRWRHFGAGGTDRAATLRAALSPRREEEQLFAKLELVITSVLLDAGAGASWSYRDKAGAVFTRSEGLAVASFDAFMGGVFSAAGSADPYRVDADTLCGLSETDVARALQVDENNSLTGLGGRAALLRTLGDVVRNKPEYFGETSPRLGRLGAYLVGQATDGELPAATVFGAVLGALSDIWPGRETLGGVNLGDVWVHPHPNIGRVPFHKLSQWLTYSLFEPLEEHGLRITGVDELTGLAEYRNGGLFVDGGVLVPQHGYVLPEPTHGPHEVSSSVVVEWRALTIALLDRTADLVRRILGLSADELPLPKVLEGGTWATGRQMAFERRKDGAPPIAVMSDGTVF